AEDPAHLGDWKGHPHRANESELHSLSFAKKVAAAFEMSRSIVRRLFSRRSRASSSRSVVVSAPGGPFPSSVSALEPLTQCRLRQVEVNCDLRDSPVTDAAEANRFSLELRGKRSSFPSLLLSFHGALPAQYRANWGVHEAGGFSFRLLPGRIVPSAPSGDLGRAHTGDEFTHVRGVRRRRSPQERRGLGEVARRGR